MREHSTEQRGRNAPFNLRSVRAQGEHTSGACSIQTVACEATFSRSQIVNKLIVDIRIHYAIIKLRKDKNSNNSKGGQDDDT